MQSQWVCGRVQAAPLEPGDADTGVVSTAALAPDTQVLTAHVG